MGCCRSIILGLFCLGILTSPAWADQNLLVKGVEAQKAGKNEQAVTLLSQYLQQYPQIPEARRYLALALAGLGRQDEALKELDQGLAKHPGDIQLLLTKANLLTSMDRRSEAIAVLTQALKCDPKNAEALKERGECQAQEGCFPEAMADLNRATQLAPKDPWVYNKRGYGVVLPGGISKSGDRFFHRHPPGSGFAPRLFLPGQYVPLPSEPAGQGHRRL